MEEREPELTRRRLRKGNSSKRPPPPVPSDDEESSIRRTRTAPLEQDGVERRSRRNLSRLFSDEFGDVLVDSSKRIKSDRKLKPTLSKNGRAATPLDIPFAPSSAVARTVSAETKLDELEELGEIRRARTHVETKASQAPLYRASSLKLHQKRRCEASLKPTLSAKESELVDCARNVGELEESKRGNLMNHQDLDLNEQEKKDHVITFDLPSEKRMSPAKSPQKLAKTNSIKKTRFEEPEKDLPPLTWMQILLHYIGLIFVQYPFKHHKQWLDKMYKSKRLQPPANHKSTSNKALHSSRSTLGSLRGRPLPTLSEACSSRTFKNPRVRRKTQLDGNDAGDDFNSALENRHGKRCSRHSRQFSMTISKHPMEPTPVVQSTNNDRPRRKSRKSFEIFGDILNAIGINTKGGRLRLPFGLSEMDESELSGFQARLYKFIKRQHKGRLARAWDHIIHPLNSMQKKHRRSTNKTRLLRAIEKQKEDEFKGRLDAVKTRLFLVSQWIFEGLSPPKYTKKPMLFTVLFPLVLVLLFGFMAGEYPYWLETNGNPVEYRFGPQELCTWVFRTESWRVFDDRFVIAWGARYLPLVESESWRWFVSLLVHEDFAHLGGNLLLFAVLSWSLESKYGFFRTGMICWLSGISGNFMSAAWEDSCGIVLGASGCIFGLAAFYVMDVIGDFKHVSFPCLRLIGIGAFLSAFIIALTSHQEASHLSHIGGFLCGMGLSVVLVPRFINERIEAFLPWVALFSALTLLCAFPLFVFHSVIPDLECNS